MSDWWTCPFCERRNMGHYEDCPVCGTESTISGEDRITQIEADVAELKKTVARLIEEKNARL